VLGDLVLLDQAVGVLQERGLELLDGLDRRAARHAVDAGVALDAIEPPTIPALSAVTPRRAVS